MPQRPPLPVRLLVLLGAVVALTCAVCAHSQPAPPTSHAQPGQATTAEPDAGAPPAQDREFFPATKAPGYLYKP